MEWLNYHHLLYFWLVVREGGIGPAATRLRLSHATVSTQIHQLEEELGEKLFDKPGRKLVLSEMGKVVYRYAEEIFALGRELMDTVKDRPTGRPLRLTVGIAEVLPKLVARYLLRPAMKQTPPVRLSCIEDEPQQLFAKLAVHEVDVVLSDAPLPAGSPVRAFNHLLGESGVTFFASRRLAAKVREGFPASLGGAPMLLPTAQAALRRSLDQWFDARGLRPDVVAEFDDSALLEVFGQDGFGVFPGHTALEEGIVKSYDVEIVGRADDLRERFWAISAERRLKHPAVVAISEVAREQTFRAT